MMFKPKELISGRLTAIVSVTAVLLFTFLLSGCEKANPTPTQAPPSDTPQTQVNQAADIAKTRVGSSIDAAIDLIRETPAFVRTSPVSYPYDRANLQYLALTAEQQALYNEMLPKVKDMIPFEYTAREHGYDVLDNVLLAAHALCRDYPEYEIYFDIEDIIEGDMTSALRSSYFLPYSPNTVPDSTDSIKKEVEIFEEECNLIVESIPEDFDAYDKYRYLAAVISLRTHYDNDFTGGFPTATAYGAVEGDLAICQGYATGFEYLCRKANLWCTQVSGISGDISHVWNLVKLESGTYHVDVTWADSDGVVPLSPEWHINFMMTQDEILWDREIVDGTVATGTYLLNSME